MKETQVDIKGTNKGEITLSSDLFGREVNQSLIAQYVYVHNQRKALGTKKTKGRGEVSGGGKKPWRQKGTGRARHGSSRSPIWVGGGHAHSIEPQLNARVRMSKQMRRAALASSLSLQYSSGKMKFIDAISLDKPQTKGIVDILVTLELSDVKTLFVTTNKDVVLEKSAHNLPKISVMDVRLLNPVDVLQYDMIVFVGDAYDQAEKLFVGSTDDGKEGAQ